MYKAMYLDCATKGPKIGGDHAQETIDIAVLFFIDALQWLKERKNKKNQIQ